MRAKTPRASRIQEFQLAASLAPQLKVMNDQYIIDKCRTSKAKTPNRRERIEEVKKSISQLTDEINSLQDVLDDEAAQYRSLTRRQTSHSEPINVSILRESIAAAVGEEEDEETTEEFGVGDDDRLLRDIGLSEQDEERRNSMLRLSLYRSTRSFNIDELMSGSPQRPKTLSKMDKHGNFVRNEYTRAVEAAEKARERLNSPFITRRGPGVTIAERAFSGTELEGTTDEVTMNDTRSYYMRMKNLHPGPAKGTRAFLESRKVKKTEEKKGSLEVVLPDPPLVTPSCVEVCGVLSHEIDGILAEVDRTVTQEYLDNL